MGHEAVSIDKDQDKINRLHTSMMLIYEPGMEALVEANVKAGCLSFGTALGEGTAGSSASFIGGSTPSHQGNAHTNLTFVQSIKCEVGKKLFGPTMAVTKSTVPVGTTDKIKRIIAEFGQVHRFSSVYTSKITHVDAAIGDFKRPNCIDIDGEDHFGNTVTYEVYHSVFSNARLILFTPRHSKRLVNHAANRCRATKITFIDEMADLYEKVNANVQDVSCGVKLCQPGTRRSAIAQRSSI